ncbi:flavodoxin family protein [Anaeromicropila herbilytica]|uniref:NADPH-dependent FMN reductase-like domain-containing protein n=1 Tax=Anaeromicropila herbilytica TaxID=2785025 RepID=A0A7R7EKZ8_9FIRM|nr:flavodoxin family protein [Anaeromicropila herbilytica]BCN30714.1 hypothetical protein bsdtb5_20090 [Anaeromicropila herbilytica]
MKTLIFNGSPRKNGDTIFLLNELTSQLEGDIKMVNAYYENIKPCIDCRYCWKKPGCAIKDDMQEIYEYILNCDNIVIASPLYFSELTGQLLSVMSRFQTFWSSKYIRKTLPIQKEKKGGIILVGGNGVKDKAYDTSKIILSSLNAKIVGDVCSFQTDKKPTNQDSEAILEVAKLAKALNK